MRRAITLLIAITAAILVLDQWTKRWATETLAHRPPVEILGDYVRLTYTRNSGIAFGLGAGTGFPYYLFSIAAALVIVYLFLSRRVKDLLRQTGLALVLGGALGNLVDRLGSGEVVDFIEVGIGRLRWPVFNVADSAVSVGVVLIAISWFRPEHPAAAGGAHEPDPRAVGAGAERGDAAGSVPGGGAEGPLP